MDRLKFVAVTFLLLTVSSSCLADDQDVVLQLRQAGEVLPLEQILSISRQQQQGRILEVELEQGRNGIIYELKILADDGQVWELKVNAKSGAIIKQEHD